MVRVIMMRSVVGGKIIFDYTVITVKDMSRIFFFFF